MVVDRISLGLNAQSLPAFGPAAFDYQSAAPGAHAGQKAVGPGAFEIVWLIGSLHDSDTITFILI